MICQFGYDQVILSGDHSSLNSAATEVRFTGRGGSDKEIKGPNNVGLKGSDGMALTSPFFLLGPKPC